MFISQNIFQIVILGMLSDAFSSGIGELVEENIESQFITQTELKDLVWNALYSRKRRKRNFLGLDSRK